MKALLASCLMLVAAAALGFVAMTGSVTVGAMDMKTDATALQSPSALKLHDNLRKLWEDHILYTRNFIISSVGNLDDADPIAQRLLRNQDDLGGAIKPYYGAEAGAKLTSLLRMHILIAADIVKAAKAGNDNALATGQARWKANADEIATFLSGANPNWDKKTLQDMLTKHLDLTTQEVTCRLTKNWAGDISAFDAGHEHMLMFSDALADGIVKQFPDKFSK